jgi:hypothetical protein
MYKSNTVCNMWRDSLHEYGFMGGHGGSGNWSYLASICGSRTWIKERRMKIFNAIFWAKFGTVMETVAYHSYTADNLEFIPQAIFGLIMISIAPLEIALRSAEKAAK